MNPLFKGMTQAEIEAWIYAHPVSGGKGDPELKAQEEAQAAFTNQLRSSFAKQFKNQTAIQSFLTAKLQPLITNPQGFDAKTLATMRTSATDQNATSFSNAEKALNTTLAARSGATSLPNGVDAQLEAMNSNAAATNEAEAQNDITLRDASLKNENFWNAVNAVNGVAAQENPEGFASDANSGSGEVANLGTAYNQSQQSQVLGALGGIAGGVGTAVGGYLGRK